MFLFFFLLQTAPTPEEMGHCDNVYLTEVGDTQVVVFKHGKTSLVSVWSLVTAPYGFNMGHMVEIIVQLPRS